MNNPPDIAQAPNTTSWQNHLLVDSVDQCRDSINKCEAEDDGLIHWGKSLKLDTICKRTSEIRFEGIRYKPRIGDFGVVQTSLVFFFIVSIIFFSRGHGHIVRSFEILKNVFLRNNTQRIDFSVRMQTEEETSMLLRIQTLALYSFSIVYYYYYHAPVDVPPMSLLVFMLQVLGGTFLLALLTLGTDHAMGTLFNERETMNKYLQIKQVLLELSGFLLWMVVLSLIYFDHLKPLLFSAVIGIFIVAKLTEWAGAFVVFFRGIHSISDFILYLCTAEIIPYILFYRFTEYCYSQSII